MDFSKLRQHALVMHPVPELDPIYVIQRLGIIYLSFVAHVSFTTSVFFNSILLCHDGNCESSAHKLSLAFCAAPLHCQHQWAAACLFWRKDLYSFTFFTHVSLTTSDIFSVSYFLCHYGKGDNSVHRLSLASQPTPPPFQHQRAAACLFWRLDLISFTFFTLFLLLYLVVF
jgi:hypothetical protein